MVRSKSAWDKLSMSERAQFIKLGLQHGLNNLKDIRDTYNLYANGGQEEILNKINSSNTNFVHRLKDPNRESIPDWESPTDRISTHKLSVGTDENGNHYIFPEVQEINGELIDFTRPPYHRFAGEISAEMRGDTVRIPSIEDGIKFTDTYKQYYPFSNGINLVHKKSGEEQVESQDLNYQNLLPEVKVYPKWYDREWAKRSAAGLSALGTIATYIPHPYAKAAGLIAQVPDIYYDTRSLVSDVKNTDNWVDEGLNTLILDPFFRKKRPLIERLGKGADYLGPFKKINIPLSALDAVNDGYYAITGNKLSNDIQSLVNNKKSTGGPLYPFSFEKNPFLKTPIVRYDDGGHLYGFGDWLINLFRPTDTTTTVVNTEPAPLDLGELATRQAYAESRFDSNAVSPANAIGLFQVTPNTLAYYNSKTGNAFTTQDLYDDTINQQVRDWYMNDLMNRPWNTKNNPSDSVQYAKSLGAYNWGPTNLVDTLNKAKADGVDIYNSWDWLTYLPTETRDYINFVLRNQNNSAHRNNIMYNRSTDKYKSKVSAIKSKN